MRIATWNVNSLPARLEKLWWWLDRARPEILLMQETKLADAAAPHDAFAERGYQLAHHGEGRWNGVAIASRVGLADVVTGFGEPLTAAATAAGSGDIRGEARMIAATCGELRVVSLYAPNGRTIDSSHYRAKLAWFERLSSWLDASCDPAAPLILGGDLNVAPTDADVWDATACHGGTHVSAPEREAFARLLRWGLIDTYRQHHDELERFTWWDYRAGHFQKNFGMRIDHLLATEGVAGRVRWSEIDRQARKGTPTPSDHAPLLLDLDEPGVEIDAGWEAAAARIAARRKR